MPWAQRWDFRLIVRRTPSWRLNLPLRHAPSVQLDRANVRYGIGTRLLDKHYREPLLACAHHATPTTHHPLPSSALQNCPTRKCFIRSPQAWPHRETRSQAGTAHRKCCNILLQLRAIIVKPQESYQDIEEG
jgi:hypothetical protein